MNRHIHGHSTGGITALTNVSKNVLEIPESILFQNFLPACRSCRAVQICLLSSQTEKLMAATKLSDYLGLKHHKKAKKDKTFQPLSFGLLASKF